MKSKVHKLVTFLVIVVMLSSVSANGNTFKVSFQYDGSWSSDEWVKYRGAIPPLEEFTVCHWERLRYFSTSDTTVWSYCSTISKSNAPLKCIGLYSTGIRSSANRRINIGVWFKGWTTHVISALAEAKKYRHRTWNHFCWTYSKTKATNKLYYNGQMIGNLSIYQEQLPKFEAPVIDGDKDTSESAFIIGQNQDNVGGGYSQTDTFYGEIAGLNMWDKDIGDSKIDALAQCKSFALGNAVSWKRDLWHYSKANVTEIKDSRIFCRHENRLVVFSKPETLSNAQHACEIHGGSLVVPRSEDENKKVIEILLKHKAECLSESESISKGKSVWLGMERNEKNWQYMTTGHFLTPKNYSNWRHNDLMFRYACAFMDNDGFWIASHNYGFCITLQLCYVCSFDEEPVFTLKGLCEKGTSLDWNFYMNLNTSNELEYYDGYKQLSKIVHSHGKWSNQIHGAKIELESIKGPHGRKMWKWYEFSCGITELQDRLLSLSACRLGEEFTCDSGHCVDMQTRCNNVDDCTDKSDETDCEFVYVPSSYRKIKPPNSDTSEMLSIDTKVAIINIDKIDTVEMQMGLTIDVSMKWFDNRVRFRNLVPEQKHLVSTETGRKLWLPLEKVIFENAILGQMHEYKNGEISVVATKHPNPSPESMSPYQNKEDFWYEGKHQALEMTLRLKMDFVCVFHLVKFPFDKQECKFILNIKDTKYSKIQLSKNDRSIVYTGPNKINEFDIGTISCWTTDVDGDEALDVSKAKFTFSVKMRRNFDDYMIMMFFPTQLLWSIAYITLFLTPGDIANRSRISVTILLVLVSLIGSIKGDIPKTSYFKYIDIWFIWYISNIFIITCFHIFMEYLYSTKKPSMTMTMVQPQEDTIRPRIDLFIRTVLFAAAILFNIIYFTIST